MADQGSELSFSQRIHVRTKRGIYISISVRPMITKFGKQVHLQELRQMRLIKQVLVTSSREVSTSTVPMANKLGRMVIDLDGLLATK